MANGGRASRQTRVLRTLLTLALNLPALAAAAAPLPVESADAVEQAEQVAARAFEAYQQGRHADAVALYEQAYASAPSADALYNIARIYDVGLGDRARAIAAYERCLLERGATPERLQRAGERIVQLRRAEAQALPSERWPVEASVEVPPPPSAASQQEQQGWSTLRGAAVISGAVGVVSVGAGLGFGVAAMSDADRANAACTGNRCRTQRGVDAAKSASTRATLATAGVGVGAALLATSVTLWILGANGETEREAPSRVRFTPVAGERELGMAVQGKW
jgi:tetratricopeptide (TPR) repeat protein